jgi:hypothetical protein
MGNTQMNKTKQLTKQQRTILTLIYRFRFVSTKHVQQALNIKHLSNTQPRMNLLVEGQYIGRNYDSSQRLAGQPASYYLLPKGMKALKEFDTDVSRQVLHNAYRDKTAQKSFIQRCLAVGDINLELEQRYGDQLEFFTQSEIQEQASDYFPQPLPHAYFIINEPERAEDDPRHYFLEICESSRPAYATKKRINEFIEYAEGGDWAKDNETKLPRVLMVCESEQARKKLKRLVDRELENSYSADLLFETSTMAILEHLDKQARKSS